MKKTIVLMLLALVMAGCIPGGKRKAEPKQSVAKEAVWDFYLIGTWKYTEEGRVYILFLNITRLIHCYL